MNPWKGEDMITIKISKHVAAACLLRAERYAWAIWDSRKYELVSGRGVPYIFSSRRGAAGEADLENGEQVIRVRITPVTK